MSTGTVVTHSNGWLLNVLKSISNGERKINFWTNNWLPNKKREADRWEVYNKRVLLLGGNIKNIYRKKSSDVYNDFKKRKVIESIGLDSRDKYSDFTDILDLSFASPNAGIIGNIIFEVDTISITLASKIDKNSLQCIQVVDKVLHNKIKKIRRVAYY